MLILCTRLRFITVNIALLSIIILPSLTLLYPEVFCKLIYKWNGSYGVPNRSRASMISVFDWWWVRSRLWVRWYTLWCLANKFKATIGHDVTIRPNNMDLVSFYGVWAYPIMLRALIFLIQAKIGWLHQFLRSLLHHFPWLILHQFVWLVCCHRWNPLRGAEVIW